MALTLVGLDIGMLGHCYGLDICMAQTLVWLRHWYGFDIGMALTLVFSDIGMALTSVWLLHEYALKWVC